MKQKIQNVGKFLRWTPWQVKLSMLVMGLGQLCYGQIVKGLFYLACFGLILTYFITTGFADFIGFFTLGTNEENLWLGIPGDNSLTMLILGLFSIFILIFTVVLYVTNVKDAVYTARQAEQGKSIHKFRQTLETAADDKFHLTALTAPVVGVSIFSILPIVFMILIAFTDLGGDVVYPRLANWSFSAWKKILSLRVYRSRMRRFVRRLRQRRILVRQGKLHVGAWRRRRSPDLQKIRSHAKIQLFRRAKQQFRSWELPHRLYRPPHHQRRGNLQIRAQLGGIAMLPTLDLQKRQYGGFGAGQSEV